MRAFSVLAVCTVGICLMLGLTLSTPPALASATRATVTIDPETLNLKSGGEWIIAYIELLEPFNVSDIDISTVYLDNVIPAESNPKYGFVKNPEIEDRDNNGIPELMVKFDRHAVINYIWSRLYHMDTVKFPREGVEIPLTIIGELVNETTFEGNDTIRVINP